MPPFSLCQLDIFHPKEVRGVLFSRPLLPVLLTVRLDRSSFFKREKENLEMTLTGIPGNAMVRPCYTGYPFQGKAHPGTSSYSDIDTIVVVTCWIRFLRRQVLLLF